MITTDLYGDLNQLLKPVMLKYPNAVELIAMHEPIAGFEQVLMGPLVALANVSRVHQRRQ